MTNSTSKTKRTAGTLDIRNVIGALLLIYGVILLLMGLFGEQAPDKTGGINANLWAGLALLLVGGGFGVWAKLRPIVVPTTDAGRPDGAPDQRIDS